MGRGVYSLPRTSDHRISLSVRVFDAAKTVADCFKYRNKIGIDVALEALREGWAQKKFRMDDLWRYATIDRVANVMRPYLETVAGGFKVVPLRNEAPTLKGRFAGHVPKPVSIEAMNDSIATETSTRNAPGKRGPP